MNNLFINVVFLAITLFFLGKLIGYSLYEIKTEKNLFGGIFLITFSIVSVVFSNLVIWTS